MKTVADLPADVLALLAPVAETVRAEAREAVVRGEHHRMVRHQEVVRRAGYDDYGYRAGMEHVIEVAFPGETSAAGTEPVRERDCRCDRCEDTECAGDCEPCWRAECEQCRCDEGYGCCGWCPGHEEHHGDPTDGDETIRVDYGRNRITVCKACDHVCED